MLMVSGIGPSTTLEQFGIPIQSDLKGVGQGMWVRKDPCQTPLDMEIALLILLYRTSRFTVSRTG